jgi:hypothetical protein
MFYMTIMSGIVTALVNNIPNVISQCILFSKFISCKFWDYCFDRYKSKLTIVTTIIDDSTGIKIECTDEYDTILRKLKEKNIKKIVYAKKAKKEENKDKKEDKKDENKEEQKQNISYYFTESQVFIIDKDIKIHINNLEKVSKEDKECQKFHQHITLLSNTHSVKELQDILAQWKKETEMNVETNLCNCISITATSTIQYGENTLAIPKEFYAIMAYIKRNKIELGNIEYHSLNSDSSRFRNSTKHESLLFVGGKNQKTKINDDIVADFSLLEKESYSTNSKIYTIKLKSLTLKSNELDNFVKNQVDEYDKEIKFKSDDGKLYYFRKYIEEKIVKKDNSDKKSENNEKTEKVVISIWDKYVMRTYKTFDNIFFQDKPALLIRLNKFLSDKESYIRKGMPHNFGLLFHGTPGCGKTSCIKALANFTQRHVVFINLQHIKTCREFERIFYDDYIDGMFVPHNKKIIVFEDIDCMSNIVTSRENDYDKIGQIPTTNNDDDDDTTDKLTLACILNTIDGIFENQDRILIISSNYPEKLDEALIRPGRIDMKIEFTKCTNNMYCDILKLCYNSEKANEVEFPKMKHTPAEIFNICSLHENIQDAIQQIRR